MDCACGKKVSLSTLMDCAIDRSLDDRLYVRARDIALTKREMRNTNRAAKAKPVKNLDIALTACFFCFVLHDSSIGSDSFILEGFWETNFLDSNCSARNAHNYVQLVRECKHIDRTAAGQVVPIFGLVSLPNSRFRFLIEKGKQFDLFAARICF